ncbi:MAG: multidrug efflux SMR transporter [Chlorobiaceae bacterium]|nr:multidrug efflux SMR transporter [Chlorobiaceae bacterium]
MQWLYLILAIIAEISGTTSMKLSAGFSKPLPSAMIFVFYGLSLTFLTLALRTMPIGFAYAIWSAVGTALITTIGVLWFGEGINTLKVVSLVLVIAGIAGLHFSQESMK